MKYSRTTSTGYVRKKDYVVGVTLQGRPKIIYKGYSYVNRYRYNCKNPGDRLKHWRCSQYNTCRAKAIRTDNGDLVLKGVHSHPETYIRKTRGYTFGYTTRGTQKLIYGGFEYVKQITDKNYPMKYWRCSRCSHCKARCILQNDGVLSVRGPHNHPPTH